MRKELSFNGDISHLWMWAMISQKPHRILIILLILIRNSVQDFPQTLWAILDYLLKRQSRRVAGTSAYNCCKDIACFGSYQKLSDYWLLSKWFKLSYWIKTYDASKSKKIYQTLYLFYGGSKAECNNLSFNVQRICTLRKFPLVSKPLSIPGVSLIHLLRNPKYLLLGIIKSIKPLF